MFLTNNRATTIPLSLYIHLPWCLKKCPYCDFNSYQVANAIPEQEYLTALLADFTNDLNFVQDRQLSSIFFGGGTPSLFSAQWINTLLAKINSLVAFAQNIEITLEVNPATVEQKYLRDYKQAGITRISLGAQSFQDEKLQTIGRIHSSKEIFLAIEKIKQAAFSSFNIDLMFGLPEQTVSAAIADLQTAIACEPTHISWYELTIEPGTLFYKNKILLPDEDLCDQIQQQGTLLLQQAGFPQYEVSAFAKPPYECHHNINYWQFGDYLGIGAGAHGKITDLASYEICRTQKIKHPQAYLHGKQIFIETKTTLTTKQISLEFMLNTLRLTNGFPLALWQQRTNLPLANINAILEKAKDMNFIDITDNYLKPTLLGKKFLNEALQLFIG
jgi:oxygen-independent coproporphyrinogen-3 oxidase